MKKLLSLLLVIFTLLSVVPLSVLSVGAETVKTGTTGDCTWTLAGTVLTISGNGKMGNHYLNGKPWGTNLTSVIIEEGVTEIGQHAFSFCDYLTSIKIPSTLVKIDDYAFSQSENIGAVYISDLAAWCNIEMSDWVTIQHSQAFCPANPLSGGGWLICNGEKIENLVIPEGVTKINKAVFCNFYYLESITFPESLTEIESKAFYGCRKLEEITLPNSLKKIGGGAFGGTQVSRKINISDLNTVLECEYNDSNSLFLNSSKLYLNDELMNEITFPQGTTAIKPSVFEGYKHL